ncbi:unnamed protein product [Linum tenue]|uniref:Uncharacterized protein n=1 Tax=Linum tenue TaxID=586396 RepID=A0AAV0RPJ2_9ROSI|nr:unnamed protein product [Linum tenue]
MGEQTQPQPQPQPPSQSQSQTQTPSESQPQSNSPTSVAPIETATVSVATVTLLPTELTAVPPPPPHSASSPLAKIPSRPRKIRKLSPEEATPTTAAADQVNTATATPAARTATAKSSRTKASNQQRALVVGPRIIARSLSCDGEVDIPIRHLRQSDPLLSSLIDLYPAPTFDTFHTPFLALTRSILYQQLAYKAGTSIYTRFISLCGGESNVLPETVLAQSAISGSVWG